MNSEDLRQRTMRFAVRVIRYIRATPGKTESQIVGKQLLRSAANYRAAGRARSKAEFFAKISIVVEEADESLFWLELIQEAQMDNSGELSELLRESKELVYIFSATRKSLREHKSTNH